MKKSIITLVFIFFVVCSINAQQLDSLHRNKVDKEVRQEDRTIRKELREKNKELRKEKKVHKQEIRFIRRERKNAR